MLENLERLTKRNIDIVSFAFTSAVVSILGVLVGLSSATAEKLPVIAGILAVAIADSSADAFGIHSAREVEMDVSQKKIYISTVFTFLVKLISTSVFIIPLLLADLVSGVIIDILFGFCAVFIIGFLLGKRRHENAWKSASLHIGFALIVVIITFTAGQWVKNLK
jgi:VIT1/CCC1 family predicted Fe2+/Mn2+ transporter